MKKLQAKSLGPLLIAGAALLWALDGVLRRNLFNLPPISIVFYEHLVGTLILTPLFYRQLRGTRLSNRALILGAIVALLSGVLGTLWFTTALIKTSFISFSVVFLLQKLQPIFATTSAAIILKERITKRYALWAGLALIAAYFTTFKYGFVDLSAGPEPVIAALFALGAAAAWGTSTTFSKMLLAETDHTIATGLRFILTTIFAGVGMAVLGSVVLPPAVSGAQWTQLVFIALSTGMVALYLYYKGLRMTQVKIATILELLFPAVALVIDAVVYQTILHPSQLAAAGILVFAIYKTSQLNQASENSPDSV